MKTSKILNRTIVSLGSLFAATLLMAEPHALNNAPDMQQLMMESKTALYATHAVNEHGFATDKVDPVLVKMIAENLTESQLALVRGNDALENTAFLPTPSLKN